MLVEIHAAGRSEILRTVSNRPALHVPSCPIALPHAPSPRAARRRTLARLAALAAAAAVPRSAGAQSGSVAPYVPSPDGVVAEMLRMAEVGPTDFVIDLGSGDGRIVLTAAKVYGARGFGVEILDDLVAQSNESARNQGIADRVKFVRQDLFQTDISPATVLTIYLLPETVNQLSDKLKTQLRPGTRVLTHDYPIGGWLPEAHQRFDQQEKVKATGVASATLYLYRVPARVGGRWLATLPPGVSRQRVTLELRQQWQKVDGMARIDDREVPIDAVELRGEQLSFRLPLARGRLAQFEGRVRDGRIAGTVALAGGPGASGPWSAVPAR
jgi:hypothetical protein